MWLLIKFLYSIPWCFNHRHHVVLTRFVFHIFQEINFICHHLCVHGEEWFVSYRQRPHLLFYHATLCCDHTVSRFEDFALRMSSWLWHSCNVAITRCLVLPIEIEDTKMTLWMSFWLWQTCNVLN